jgi:hypothetical protein
MALVSETVVADRGDSRCVENDDKGNDDDVDDDTLCPTIVDEDGK